MSTKLILRQISERLKLKLSPTLRYHITITQNKSLFFVRIFPLVKSTVTSFRFTWVNDKLIDKSTFLTVTLSWSFPYEEPEGPSTHRDEVVRITALPPICKGSRMELSFFSLLFTGKEGRLLKIPEIRVIKDENFSKRTSIILCFFPLQTQK